MQWLTAAADRLFALILLNGRVSHAEILNNYFSRPAWDYADDSALVSTLNFRHLSRLICTVFRIFFRMKTVYLYFKTIFSFGDKRARYSNKSQASIYFYLCKQIRQIDCMTKLVVFVLCPINICVYIENKKEIYIYIIYGIKSTYYTSSSHNKVLLTCDDVITNKHGGWRSTNLTFKFTQTIISTNYMFTQF